MQSIPTKLRFSIGGFGPGWEVTWDGTKVVAREGFFGDDERVVSENVPTDVEWKTFWETLDNADVWKWEPHYFKMILDGTSWSLESSHNGRMICSKGDNAYPGTDADVPYNDGPFELVLNSFRRIAKMPHQY